ncbi:hypothetical protein, partial [Vibrio fluvialis]
VLFRSIENLRVFNSDYIAKNVNFDESIFLFQSKYRA